MMGDDVCEYVGSFEAWGGACKYTTFVLYMYRKAIFCVQSHLTTSVVHVRSMR